MYLRHRTMRLYTWVSYYAEKAWTALQWIAIVYVLYMAISQVYVGIVRDAEYRGEERKKLENLETWKRMNATPKAHK